MKKKVLGASFQLLVLWGLGGSVDREWEYGRIKEGGLEKASHQEERNLFLRPCRHSGTFPASSKLSLSGFS